MASAEVIAAIQLIDACIGITKTILDIGRAVTNAQGLPPKLRELCEKLPAIEELLESAHGNCRDGKVNKDNSKVVKPILKQCEEALAELRDIFRKACPKEEDDRTKRIWRGTKTVFLGRDGQVQKLLVIVQDNLRLLEQREVIRIDNKLDELWQVTEALARGDGDNPNNNVVGGRNNRQAISHGTYKESSSST
jgi:hypothetical protein